MAMVFLVVVIQHRLMLTRLYVEALLVDENQADQVINC